MHKKKLSNEVAKKQKTHTCLEVSCTSYRITKYSNLPHNLKHAALQPSEISSLFKCGGHFVRIILYISNLFICDFEWVVRVTAPASIARTLVVYVVYLYIYDLILYIYNLFTCDFEWVVRVTAPASEARTIVVYVIYIYIYI